MKKLPSTIILIITLLLYLCPIVLGQSAPNPPRILDSTYSPPVGKAITVNTGGNLQAALDSAVAGDVVILQAGAVFTGNFLLKPKSGTAVIHIVSSELLKLPVGVRVTPASSPLMPRIVSPNKMGALSTQGSASNIRLIGVEITVAAGVTDANNPNTGLLRFGEGNEATVEALPKNLVVDRCYVHGSPTAEITRGIALNCGPAAVIDSYISDIHSSGFDSQAIAGWNGNGPFKITGNFIEAAGENVMFGGSDSMSAALIPADIEIRRNEFFKPLAWRTAVPLPKVKNLFELKDAKRVLVEGNTFSNCWGPTQGYAINIKSANQGGGFGEWSTTEDVLFINNIVRSAHGGINVSGPDENTQQTTKRVKIENNLFYDIDGGKYNGSGNWIQVANGVQGVEVAHNTAMHTGKAVEADLQPSTGFIFRDNITPHNLYGIKGSGQSVGIGTLNFYFPGHVFKKNLLIGAAANLYPADNYFAPDLAAVGFRDASAGDYRLRVATWSGTDSKPVGVDMEALEAALRGTPSPSPGPGPVPTSTDLFKVSKEGNELVMRDASGNVIKRWPLQ